MTMTSSSSGQHSAVLTQVLAGLYVVSGVCQPLIMVLCKQAGLADPTAQLYMLFYYFGPSLLLVTMLYDINVRNNNNNNNNISKDVNAKDEYVTIAQNKNSSSNSSWPRWTLVFQAAGIASFDVMAQGLNYTGASLAGPTIFAIVYSSVTVWTAVFSRLLLKRSLTWFQWIMIFTVFGGLVITATDSVKLGDDVKNGTIIILIGSCMHATTYVMSEHVMLGSDGLTAAQNSAIQGVVAFTMLLAWQLIYTRPQWDHLIAAPAHDAQTTFSKACAIMLAFALANLIHSVTFYSTIKHYPGGATSAGVMKGLQAVLVFVVSHLIYCGKFGGSEMCFTITKFISLVTVVSGVVGFSISVERQQHNSLQRNNGQGYTQILQEVETP